MSVPYTTEASVKNKFAAVSIFYKLLRQFMGNSNVPYTVVGFRLIEIKFAVGVMGVKSFN